MELPSRPAPSWSQAGSHVCTTPFPQRETFFLCQLVWKVAGDANPLHVGTSQSFLLYADPQSQNTRRACPTYFSYLIPKPVPCVLRWCVPISYESWVWMRPGDAWTCSWAALSLQVIWREPALSKIRGGHRSWKKPWTRKPWTRKPEATPCRHKPVRTEISKASCLLSGS